MVLRAFSRKKTDERIIQTGTQLRQHPAAMHRRHFDIIITCYNNNVCASVSVFVCLPVCLTNYPLPHPSTTPPPPPHPPRAPHRIPTPTLPPESFLQPSFSRRAVAAVPRLAGKNCAACAPTCRKTNDCFTASLLSRTLPWGIMEAAIYAICNSRHCCGCRLQNELRLILWTRRET